MTGWMLVMEKSEATQLTKLILIGSLVICSLIGAIVAELFDYWKYEHIELFFSIGMSFTMVAAFFISIWTFLDWREEQKK